MRIDVEQRHIDEGVRHSGMKCPVALALLDAGFERPVVGPYGFADGDVIYSLSGGSRDFVASFDRGLSVEPITLETTHVKSIKVSHADNKG